MPVPPLPPLRVREVDGAPNAIPVFEIVVSNNTLEDLGGGSVSIGVPSGGTGASTANSYVTWQAELALSAEKILTAGSSVVIHTDATAIYIDALTGGGASTVYAATGNSYLVLGSATDLLAERIYVPGLGIVASDSGANAGYYVEVNTPFLVTSNRTINTTAPVAGGGNLGADRTFTVDTAFLVGSTRTLNTTYPVAGGGNLSADRTFSVDTAFLVTSNRILTAGTGLSGGGNLGADRVFSVNANIRRRTAGFFLGGNLTTTMIPEEARVYIPHNTELTNIWLAVTTTPVGANILLQLYQFPSPISTGSAFFSAGSRPIITTGNAVGIGSEGGAFLNVTAYAGSWLGCSLDQAGSTTAGSNLTVNVIGITS